MKPRFLILFVLLLACGSLLADDTPVKGAKEIFFDPTDGAIVSASQPNSFKAPSAHPPGKTGKTGPGRTATAPKKKEPVDRLAQKEPKPTTPFPEPPPGRRPIAIEAVNKTSTLGLSYWIELVGQDGTGQPVTDGRIFRSGEKIRIHFRSNADGNIALLQLGSTGTSSVLFPDPTKRLNDSRIAAGEDRILPAESAWFRFDDTPGTEKILALFAKSQQEIDNFSIQPKMDATATQVMLASVKDIRGGKDLILETETEKVSEIGGYAVNLAGKPVVMEIQLKHQ